MAALCSMLVITAVRVTHTCAMAIAATISSTSTGVGVACRTDISSFRLSILRVKALAVAIRATIAVRRLSTDSLLTRVPPSFRMPWATTAISHARLPMWPPRMCLTPKLPSMSAKYFINIVPLRCRAYSIWA